MLEYIRNELLGMTDKGEYAALTSSLIPGCDNIIGIRQPVLKQYAKQLIKENKDFRQLLSEPDIYQEETLLRSYIIGMGTAKEKDFKKALKDFNTFVPLVNNWAVNDSFCVEFRVMDMFRDEFLPYIKECIESFDEYRARVGLIMLLDHYLKVDMQVVEDMLYVADDLGIQYFTVYAFSTENWKRSEEEVGTLMSILRKYLKDCVKKSMKNNVRCRVIGRREELSDDIVESINNLEEKTKNNTGLNFTIAINYGGRDEIVRAVQKIAQDVKEGKIAPEAIDEAMINANLDTKDIPDPDLLIRTSGEQRLSNYLPWQLAYTEFYFTDVFWPDFNREELIKACEKYNKRDRRYGGVKEE